MKVLIIVGASVVSLAVIVLLVAYVATAKDRLRARFFDAVRANDTERVRELLEKKRIDVTTMADPRGGRSPLAIAAQHANVDMARLFVDRNADVNAATRLLLPALDLAVLSGSLDMVRFLVERGAVVDAVADASRSGSGKAGVTALMLAAGIGKADIARFLIEHGADVSARAAEDFSTPGGTLSVNFQRAADMARMTGTDLGTAWDDIMTQALAEQTEETFFKPPLLLAIENGDAGTTALLLEHGADPRWTSSPRGTLNWLWPFFRGFTPLMYAAHRGRTEALAALIDAGADVNTRDENGQTAFLYAAARGRIDAMDLLIRSGADGNASAADGENAPFYAVRGGSVDGLRHLIDHGIALDARNSMGYTALRIIATPDTPALAEMAEMLRTAGAR